MICWYLKSKFSTCAWMGLQLLKHTCNVSDEGVVATWVESHYWQYFCDEQHFRPDLRIDPCLMCSQDAEISAPRPQGGASDWDCLCCTGLCNVAPSSMLAGRSPPTTIGRREAIYHARIDHAETDPASTDAEGHSSLLLWN
jgi:hypothetical protein